MELIAACSGVLFEQTPAEFKFPSNANVVVNFTVDFFFQNQDPEDVNCNALETICVDDKVWWAIYPVQVNCEVPKDKLIKIEAFFENYTVVIQDETQEPRCELPCAGTIKAVRNRILPDQFVKITDTVISTAPQNCLDVDNVKHQLLNVPEDLEFGLRRIIGELSPISTARK
ncbi:hypothetical protein SprV_0100402300 [Sparganum proliferum]